MDLNCPNPCCYLCSGGWRTGGPTVVIRGFQLHRRLAPQPPTLFKSHLYSRSLCPWVTPPALLLEDGLSLCNRFSSSQPPLVLRFGIQQAWLKAECFGKVPIGIQSHGIPQTKTVNTALDPLPLWSIPHILTRPFPSSMRETVKVT